MRNVPQSIHDAWLGGEFTGDRRPMARVTLQRLGVQLQKVDDQRLFASALFGQADIPREMPNVKSVEWDRAVGSDVASCTIVFYNTFPLPLGEQPTSGGDFDLPGYYTYNYGATSWATSRWGTTANAWQDYLLPDRVLRTYEGYGFDASLIPERDPHLVQTGVWLIDDIEASTDGLITVTCRDMGRLLLDHIMFPPVIPRGFYPMIWDPYHQVDNPDVIQPIGVSYRPTYITDSGVVYYGKNALIHGHRPSDAFDDAKPKTYWLSVGNALPNAGYSYEYVEGSCFGMNLSSVEVNVWGGPYRAYLSVKIKGVWSGTKKIPYDPNNPTSHPNGADIPYSMVMTIGREENATFRLTHPVANVDAIRVTFTGLYNSGIGPFRYRAGVRSIRCNAMTTTTKDGGTHTAGNYGDYTDIVKYLLACGGFHWPNTTNAYLTWSDKTRHALRPAPKVAPTDPPPDDPALHSGRIWGDLEQSGTTAFYDPVTHVSNQLDATIWDKKPLMDGIAYIRDILGFIFFIDETGGAVFRMPNIHTLGNFVGDVAVDAGYHVSPPPVGHDDPILVIDEKQTLIGMRAKISSKNIREQVFVANANGQFGAIAQGYNPVTPDPGLRRVGGWTDQNFKDAVEAQKMADMITVAQAFTFRSNTVSIVANPAIQIDDQVRIYERVTGEGFFHYVKGIRSSNSLEDGKWTYDLTTNWLGEVPYTKWAFNPAQLHQSTQDYLNAILQNRTVT